jgi:hypothetical protein
MGIGGKITACGRVQAAAYRLSITRENFTPKHPKFTRVNFTLLVRKDKNEQND